MMKGATSAELLDKVGSLLKTHVPPPLPQSTLRPGPEEILSKLCALSDQELYSTTVKSMEWKTILENLGEGILLVDMERRVSSANHFLCGLLGILEADVAATLQLIERALDKNQEPTCDSEIHGHSGKITPVSISVALVRDYLGEVVGFVCLFQDITRRKQVESLNQLKNDLTDMIVHDLRTPLTSLLTGMQTVALLGEMNEDQKEFMGISIEGGQILLGMINDLLDISKMEDGSLKLETSPLETAELLKRATRQVSSLAEAKGLQMSCNVVATLPPVQGDEDKLLRTLVNLLSNAIKFTPDGGTITVTAQPISLALRHTLGDGVLLTVQDTGEGIPKEAFERVFEKFGQVETRKSGRKMSSGLGLTFCKMVVEAHGGRIWVESEVGQGTTFFLSIPAPDPD
jgi:signal transduction histidine kinase